MRSRDSLQLEYTDCLLDKNRLRKRIAELQANMEQQQRELERESEKSKEQTEQSSSCLHCVSQPSRVLADLRHPTSKRYCSVTAKAFKIQLGSASTHLIQVIRYFNDAQ